MLRPLLAAAFLLLGGCAAHTDEDAPKPAIELTGRVVDSADILRPEFEAELTRKLGNLETQSLVQLVVATTTSLEGYDINTYSLDLARAWGLGDSKRNDGLLLLVAPNERQVRIEVGKGLEGKVKDQEAATIIRDRILPHFREGDYESGVDVGVDELILELTSTEMKEAA